MRVRLSQVLIFAAVLSFPFNATATTIFVAFLDGDQEVPPTVTPATGFATVELNDTEDFLSISLTFQDLLAPQTAAHIHRAPPGVNGPVIIPLPLGSFTAFLAAIGPADVAELEAGTLYINVHSQLFPGGEIRGQLQIQQIPEPGTFFLLGFGLLALRGARSRT